MTEQTPSTGTLAIVFKIAERIIDVILFTLVMVLAGSFGAIAGLLIAGPPGAIIGFLVVGIFVAWSLFALLNWAAVAAVGALRRLVEHRDGPDQPWNRAEEDFTEPTTAPEPAPAPTPAPEPAQSVAVKEAPPAQAPARVETPAIREESAVATPGALIVKVHISLRAELHVHEHGLLLYKGVMPVLAGSLPPYRARVELVKDFVGGHIIVRDADGSIFCKSQNHWMGRTRKAFDGIKSLTG